VKEEEVPEKHNSNREHRCSQPQLGDLFIFYVNGTLPSDQRRMIEEHVSKCPECREELRFFATVKEAVTKDQPPQKRSNVSHK
jgi:anti-sigma factor RsiW